MKLVALAMRSGKTTVRGKKKKNHDCGVSTYGGGKKKVPSMTKRPENKNKNEGFEGDGTLRESFTRGGEKNFAQLLWRRDGFGSRDNKKREVKKIRLKEARKKKDKRGSEFTLLKGKGQQETAANTCN